MEGRDTAARIDQAWLKLDGSASVRSLKKCAEQALSHGFRSICVMPLLAGTLKKNYPELRVAAVVSYPLGLDTLHIKSQAVQQLIAQGVDELDIVYDLFALVNGNMDKVKAEAQVLGSLTSEAGVFHKAIIETPILSDARIAEVCGVLLDSPIDCVKTSTGYGREASSLDHVRIMRSVVTDRKQVKASGGIKSLYDLRTMVEAGADIIGTSSGPAIMAELAAAEAH